MNTRGLADVQKDIMRLYFEECYSLKQIAQKLDIKETDVMFHYQQAIEHLRPQLDKHQR